MTKTERRTDVQVESTNGVPSLEATLGQLFADQQRLREQLDQTRAQLDQVNREVLRVQADYCTDARREEEYRRCVQRLLGIDPYIDPREIAEARNSKQSVEEFLAELEAMGKEQPEVAHG